MSDPVDQRGESPAKVRVMLRKQSMVATRFYTAADLAAMGSDAPYELIDGELREVAPCFDDPSRIGVRISSPLFVFVEEHGLGEVFGADGGFRLPGGKETVVAPDVSFLRVERIPANHDFQSFFLGAPDLAVEVGSLSNTPGDVADKVRRYLAAGSRLVWVVWPLSQTVVVHRPGQEPETLRVGDILDGENVLPGFRLAVRSIFKEPRRSGQSRA
jgi:Uma2 family endonuclease